MRKEVLFAIVSGVTIGLIIAFGTWKIFRAIKKPQNISVSQKTPPPSQTLGLSISNLNDFDIITDNPYVVTGVASPDTDIIISTSEEDFYTKTNKDGVFEIEVEFPAGLSEIKINDKKILVVFSEEFKKYTNTESEITDAEDKSTKNTTEEGKIEEELEVIREKVKNEIANKSVKKTSYVGVITDISSTNIQIKSLSGDIKQISVNNDSSFINTLKKNVEVKLNDLAIGDYIVAMGFINGNKVLDGKRILISSPIEPNTYNFEAIKIMSINKNKINDITLPKKWKGPDINSLETGQDVIIVGLKDQNKSYTLRSIFTPVE